MLFGTFFPLFFSLLITTMTADFDFFSMSSFLVKINALHVTIGLGSQLLVLYTYKPRPTWIESAPRTDPEGTAEFERGW